MPDLHKFDASRLLAGLALLVAVAAAWKFETPATPGTATPARPADLPRRTAKAVVATPSVVSVWRRPFPWWKQVLLNTTNEVGDDRLIAVAAGVVFFALLAIFPTITAFVSFYGLFASYDTINDHIALLNYALPPGGVDIVKEQIGRIVSKDGKLGFGFAAGLLMALGCANAGIKTVMDALNVIEDENEGRGFIKLNIVSLTFTLGAIVFLLLAVGAVVAFPLVMSTFGLSAIADTTTWLIRWPALLAIVLLGLSVLYRFGPNRKEARWHVLTPGTLFAAFAWIAGSAALSVYLSYFADYNATYGSLGAAIGLMMWMWLTAIVVLVGAELDSEIDKMSAAG